MTTANPNRRAMLALLVLSGLIISLGMGLRQSLGLFMRPITLDVGVSAATFGFSLAFRISSGALRSPLSARSRTGTARARC